MNTYNNTIAQQLFDYVTDTFQKVEDSDEKGRKIKVAKYEMIEPENENIGYLTINGLTGQFTLLIYFEIYDSEDKLIEKYTRELYVPKLINEVFVIEGRLRIPTNTLDNDYIVRVNKSYIKINNSISVDYDESKPNKGLVVNTMTSQGESFSFDGTDENFLAYKDFLKLGETEKLKIQIKLDVDDIGDYLTRSIVLLLIKRGPDSQEDNIIDKKIYNTESELIYHLYRWTTRKKVLGNTKKKFWQYGTCFLTDIQNTIDRYFKVADDKTVEIPTTINPLIFDALKYKIMIPDNVAFTKSMADLIDIVNTPINNNVNKINELNICTSVEDGVIYYNCYSYPTGEKVRLEYLKYLNHPVLLNQYWDYDNNKVIPDSEGKVRYTLRQVIHQIDESEIESSKIDLVEPAPDEKLSISSRQIPMINMSDTIRLAMATSMEKQALQILNSEPRLVSSGHDDSDFLNSTLLIKYKGNGGRVTKIKGNKVFVEDDDTGSVEYFEIPAPMIGMNDSTIAFEIVVKEGDVVKSNDIIISPHNIKSNTFGLGINTNVAYMDYLGYTYEDGVVISESYSNKLMHFGVVEVTKQIHSNDIIRYLRKIGSKVKSKDILINVQSKLRVSDELGNLFDKGNKGLLQKLNYQYNQENLIAPNNCDEGYVVDVNINIPEYTINLESEYSVKVIKEFDKNIKSNDYDWLPDEYKMLEASKSDPANDKLVGTITYMIVLVKRAKIGDKVCNTYGSKGIISLIVPDSLMPRLDLDGEGNGPIIEMIMNPPAVTSRKNPSQIYECALTNCIEKIYEISDKYISDSEFNELRTFLHKFYGTKFDKYTDTELINNHKFGLIGYKMKVGSYSKINHDLVKDWINYLGVKETSYVYVPDVVIVHNRNDSSLRVFDPKTYTKKDGDEPHYHELGFTDKEVVFGKEYTLKLYHSGDYTGKVTSSIVTKGQPVMGRGLFRDGGQKIGEMELWALLSYGTEGFVRNNNPKVLQEQYNFINELLISGYVITDEDGIPILSNYRSKLDKLRELGKK